MKGIIYFLIFCIGFYIQQTFSGYLDVIGACTMIISGFLGAKYFKNLKENNKK